VFPNKNLSVPSSLGLALHLGRILAISIIVLIPLRRPKPFKKTEILNQQQYSRNVPFSRLILRSQFRLNVSEELPLTTLIWKEGIKLLQDFEFPSSLRIYHKRFIVLVVNVSAIVSFLLLVSMGYIGLKQSLVFSLLSVRARKNKASL
jgi:hypothetical protein